MHVESKRTTFQSFHVPLWALEMNSGCQAPTAGVFPDSEPPWRPSSLTIFTAFIGLKKIPNPQSCRSQVTIDQQHCVQVTAEELFLISSWMVVVDLRPSVQSLFITVYPELGHISLKEAFLSCHSFQEACEQNLTLFAVLVNCLAAMTKCLIRNNVCRIGYWGSWFKWTLSIMAERAWWEELLTISHSAPQEYEQKWSQSIEPPGFLPVIHFPWQNWIS